MHSDDFFKKMFKYCQYSLGTGFWASLRVVSSIATFYLWAFKA